MENLKRSLNQLLQNINNFHSDHQFNSSNIIVSNINHNGIVSKTSLSNKSKFRREPKNRDSTLSRILDVYASTTSINDTRGNTPEKEETETTEDEDFDNDSITTFRYKQVSQTTEIGLKDTSM